MKNYLFLTFALFATTTLFAQLTGNSLVVGGKASAAFGFAGNTFSGKFSPSIGYQTGKLSFGVKADIGAVSINSISYQKLIYDTGIWGRYYFLDNRKVTPFVELGMGYGRFQANRSFTGSYATANMTWGAAWFPVKHIALTAGINYGYTSNAQGYIPEIMAISVQSASGRFTGGLGFGINYFIHLKEK